MTDLPRRALSIRQPWAWAILHAGKDVENRSWKSSSIDYGECGRFAIHAGKGLTREEYDAAADSLASLGVRCPPAAELLRGGIVGSVEIIDYVREFPSRWFAGPTGLLLRNARPCEFIPSKGQLGFFYWSRADASTVPEPARWMLPQQPKPEPVRTGDLFS